MTAASHKLTLAFVKSQTYQGQFKLKLTACLWGKFKLIAVVDLSSLNANCYRIFDRQGTRRANSSLMDVLETWRRAASVTPKQSSKDLTLIA